jgi:hypothetical protein
VSQWEPGFGFDPAIYKEWLTEKGIDDNISNRQRHMFEVLPPDTVTPESFFKKR